jgi:oxygen-independent coproporphyrinogen-3 oxidase
VPFCRAKCTYCNFDSGVYSRTVQASYFALPGCASRHNLKYWNRESYLGFGSSAHSFNGAARWANAAEATDYIASVQQGRSPVEFIEPISVERAVEEAMFLGLRKRSGIDLARVVERYGPEIVQRFEPTMRKLEAAGLLRRNRSVVSLAPEASLISNEAFCEFVE